MINGWPMEHPFIISTHFVYFNSDGSGPEIMDTIDGENTLRLMKKLYEEFCANSYH